MDITKTKLEGEAKDLLSLASGKVEAFQAELDKLNLEFQEKAKELEAIKARIRPIKAKLSDAAQIQAGIANRRSRAKYFPEFATRNFDDSKDKEFFEFVKKNIPDKD